MTPLAARGPAPKVAASMPRMQAVAPPAPVSKEPARKLWLPIALSSCGLVVAIAYYINASIGGGRWALGPVPLNWIAGLLVVSGLALVMFRLVFRED